MQGRREGGGAGGGKIPGARSAQRGPETGPEIYLVGRTAIQSAGLIFGLNISA